MDELALIKAAQNDDLDAFNRLILAHQEMVFNVACRILVNPDAAEDAVQESFISAYNNLRSFRGGSFKAWLLRVVTNKCYDELRRQKTPPPKPNSIPSLTTARTRSNPHPGWKMMPLPPKNVANKASFTKPLRNVSPACRKISALWP